MILILASRRDRVARELAARWAASGASLVTVSDLCAPGWQLGEGGAQSLRVNDRVRPAAEVQGVLVRLVYVPAEELKRIAEEDREYAAAEINAFLLAWLTSLDVPLLNRPGPGLSGASWRPEQWARAAAECGIRARPARRSVPGDGDGPRPLEERTVTVAGDRCIGSDDEAIVAAARAIARRAGLALVDVRFDARASEPTFTGASPWPDLLRDDVGEAALAALTAPAANGTA